eukprot:TRINITY_DN9802_c0_g1_i1.p1 TRINITY_DN9802_c0_g1~~TRINITY_DN9802_c0_g1_i1.p1  ORF type:complete len:104 (+),score=1.34 TRINITY_DN9802_c0_g1_i1:124-435(+)
MVQTCSLRKQKVAMGLILANAAQSVSDRRKILEEFLGEFPGKSIFKKYAHTVYITSIRMYVPFFYFLFFPIFRTDLNLNPEFYPQLHHNFTLLMPTFSRLCYG